MNKEIKEKVLNDTIDDFFRKNIGKIMTRVTLQELKKELQSVNGCEPSKK